MGHRVLVAAELEPLLEPGQLAGLDVTWIAADEPTPRGTTTWTSLRPSCEASR